MIKYMIHPLLYKYYIYIYMVMSSVCGAGTVYYVYTNSDQDFHKNITDKCMCMR
jgi:hypothetical protein